jgi:hypothetical protein
VPTRTSGSDVLVQYDNTLRHVPLDGNEGWMKVPPAIGLAHDELVHAWTAMGATAARGEGTSAGRKVPRSEL